MEWISIPISVVIISFLLWFARNIIKEFLTNSIKHDYDVKIEELKSKLKEQETETSLLRSGALAAIKHRQEELYKYQLESISVMWKGVIKLKKMKGISATKHSIPFKVLANEAKKDQRIQDVLDMVTGEFNIADDLNIDAVSEVRPYLSPLSWAYFSAYHLILTHDALEVSLQKLGSRDILDNDPNNHLSNIVKLALPEYSEYIEKHKNTSLYQLLEKLENKLLEEFDNILEGKTNDTKAIQRSANILEETKKFMGKA